MDAVGEDVVRYAGTDMVCYRAATPEELVARQAAAWDPIIAFAADDLGARFVLAEGVMHVTQPPQALAAFQAEIAKVREPFALTALHMATTLTGSALIAMAMARGVISVEEAWAKAHLEEDWTAELWGEDLEATHRRKARFVDMKVAAMVLRARSF
jgi:chaperone required for assembly of F1-ATPase